MRGAAKHPTIHRTASAPAPVFSSPPTSIALRWRNPCIEASTLTAGKYEILSYDLAIWNDAAKLNTLCSHLFWVLSLFLVGSHWMDTGLWAISCDLVNERIFADKGPSSQSCGFSSTVWVWEVDRKEGWALKNRCFWTVVLEKTLESPFGLKGDQTHQSQRKSVLNIHWKDWCWSWNSNILATWFEKLIHWKRPWCWERLKAGGEGDDRRWCGWMASLTQWTWLWANSMREWRTEEPGVLWSKITKSQTRLSNWATMIREEANRGLSFSWVRTDILTKPACEMTTSKPKHGGGNGSRLQRSCLENPRDRGAWWAAVYGVTQSQTPLKRLGSSSSSRPEHEPPSVPPRPTRVSSASLGSRGGKAGGIVVARVWAAPGLWFSRSLRSPALSIRPFLIASTLF